MNEQIPASVKASRMQEAGFTFFTFKLSPGAIGPGHFHYYPHFMVLHRGKIRLVVDGVEHFFDATEMPHFIYIDENKQHGIQAIDGDAVYTCQFRWRDEFGEFVEELEKAERNHAEGRVGPASVDELFKRITRAGCGECSGCT